MNLVIFFAASLQLVSCFIIRRDSDATNSSDAQNCESATGIVEHINKRYSRDKKEPAGYIVDLVQKRQELTHFQENSQICASVAEEGCNTKCFWFSNMFPEIQLETELLVQISQDDQCDERWEPVSAVIESCEPTEKVLFYLPLNVTKKNS